MNSLAILSILTISLYIGCAQEVSEKCELLLSSDRTKFESIGLFHSYYIDGWTAKAEYFMYNKNSGKKWRIDLKYNSNTKVIFGMEFIKGTTEPIPANAVNMFGMGFERTGNQVFGDKYVPYDCFAVYKDLKNLSIETHCVGFNKKVWIDSDSQYDPESILFLPKKFPLSGKVEYYRYLVVLNRKNRNTVEIYVPRDRILCVANHTDCYGYTVPTFAIQLQSNGDLYTHIEGITPYDNIDDKYFGHLILFNINGSLKFCNTPNRERLAVNCRPENLRPYAEECNQYLKRTETTKQPNGPSDQDPDEPESHPILVTIFLILLVLAVILPVIDLILLKRRRDKWVFRSNYSSYPSQTQTTSESTKKEVKIPSFFNRMSESSESTKKSSKVQKKAKQKH